MRGWLRVVPAAVVCLTAALVAGCGSSGDTSSSATQATTAASSTTAAAPAEAPAMTGPHGEPAAGPEAVRLSAKDVSRIRAGAFTVAFAWHTTDTFTKAVEIAARRRLQELGIRVVAATVADFDPAKQESDLKTIEALKPDVIVTLPVDPASSAKMYREAGRAGAKLVFVSNVPAGFRHGEDYVGVVTTDVVGAARESARLLGEKLGGKGKVGVLFYDAKFFIVNQWDEAFEEALKQRFPGIEIAARAGFADPARANEPASAMLARNPDLDGLYVSWQDPAVGVLTALRAAGRTDVAVTDVGMNETTALEMVRGGAFIGAGVDGPVAMGAALADEVGCAVLGRAAPAFLVSGFNTITKDDVLDKWPEVYGVPAPAPVVAAAEG
jgi:ribose transport system substrate-binding protein